MPSPPALATVIEQLLLGPTAIETSAGYTSALPEVARAGLGQACNDEIGYVELRARSLSTLSREKQILAMGQLVLTAYEVGANRGDRDSKWRASPRRCCCPMARRTTLATPRDFHSLLNG